MTKPKTTTSDSSAANTMTRRQAMINEKRASNNGDSPLVGESLPSASLGKEAHAYVYGLLPSESMQEFEQQMEQSGAIKNSFDDAKQFQDILSYWSDVPAPSGLADRTFEAIQKKITSEVPATPDSPLPSDPDAI